MEARLMDLDSLGPQVAPKARRDSSLMHTVNSNVRRRAESADGSEAIAFFCECQIPGCYAPIWLSAADFDEMFADDPGWLLLEGHVPSALWHRREPLPTRHTANSKRHQVRDVDAEPVTP